MIVFLKSVCLSYDLKGVGLEYNEGWLNCYIKFSVKKILLINIFVKIIWLGNFLFV